MNTTPRNADIKQKTSEELLNLMTFWNYMTEKYEGKTGGQYNICVAIITAIDNELTARML